MTDLDIRSWFFLGTVPPPLGGVTIFAKRKIAAWRAIGKTVVLVDIKRLDLIAKLKYFLHLLLAGQNTGIYINDLSGFNLAAAGFNFFGARVYFHDHNYNLAPIAGWRGWLLRKCLARCEEIFFDGVHSRDGYIKSGFMSKNKKYSFSSPFIAPDLAERQDILASYPIHLFDFLKTHSPVIGANAYKIVLDDNGVDIYGVDMAIALLERLRRSHPQAGVVFAVAVEEEGEYVLSLKEGIREKGLEAHFLFLVGANELWPLFGLVDVFIRPSSTDGYGISVAEAIFVGTPAVASDVCVRADGTVLFHARNQEDFQDKVLQQLRNL